MRTRKTAMVCIIAILFTMPVFAQEYGTGVTLTVPQVDPAALTIDGVADEAAWATAPEIDLTTNWDGAWSGHPDADIEAMGKVLYAEDTLYVTVTVQDYQRFYWGQPGDPWQGEQILIGIDPTHAGDDQVDTDWGGWPANAPDKGPYAYKVNIEGATLNWGYDGISAADSGWVNSAVVVDSTEFSWTIELAAYAPQIGQGAQIGFNIGGATASWDLAEENADSLGVPGDGAYAYFAWQVCAEPTETSTCQYAGGNVMSDAASFATLILNGDDGTYGTGVTLDVPRVNPADLVIDGVANESVWQEAPEVDLVTNWDGAWSGHPDADVEALGRVLYAEDTLYVTVTIQDYQRFYWGQPGNQWQGEQVLIGIDPTHAGDDQRAPDYSGWPENAPDKGPYTYKVNIEGATLDWGYWGISAADSGWVNSAVTVDSVNFTWTVELAAYAPQIEPGAQIGFNIGGATASWDFAEENADSLGVPGEGTYAYFAWQVCPEPGAESTCQSPGGNVMSDAGSFATLNLTNVTVDIEKTPGSELPSEFELGQNYPNPFNPTTTIEFSITRTAQVALEVFNTLGQKVDTIADTALPAGNYSVQWQAGDLASGVYLYQLKVDGNIVASKKMLLAK